MARVRQMTVKLCYRSVWVALDTWADTVAYEKEEARRSADRAIVQHQFTFIHINLHSFTLSPSRPKRVIGNLLHFNDIASL